MNDEGWLLPTDRFRTWSSLAGGNYRLIAAAAKNYKALGPFSVVDHR
jgi:hypothetical protein